MVKFGKNKLKMLNKLSKAEKNESKIAGKISKKKHQVINQASSSKKTSIIKELATNNELVELKTGDSKRQLRFAKSQVTKESKKPVQPKQKPVEKQKKRQKTQISDTKLLLKLMKKK